MKNLKFIITKLVTLQVLLNDEPVSSRQVLVSIKESEEDPDPDNMVFMVARRGTNVTLNCSDLGETGEVTWSRQGRVI